MKPYPGAAAESQPYAFINPVPDSASSRKACDYELSAEVCSQL